MEHIFCLNSNSFPALDSDKAYDLFSDSLQGVLALNTGTDRYVIYHDSASSEPLEKVELSETFTYLDFKERLLENGEQDVFLFLEEIEDKSPAMDHLPDDIIDDLTSYSFYMPNYGIANNPEVFGIAWFMHAILLSIDTDEQWCNHKIQIARTFDGKYIDEKLLIKNIAQYRHGKLLSDEFNKVDIQDSCGECFFSEDFLSWYEEQTDDNKVRVRDKLSLACEKGFNGGKPLFKNLADAEGLREIRFSAYPGGAIRILFKSLGGLEHAILVGFIKKNDNEGYESNIVRANDLFQAGSFSRRFCRKKQNHIIT
ncbi:conserved hypothetical protein [Bathymodiolus platifrons methanotrophic gill symbiont]|uniref:type II toxin-antitoxin system RelE/ParE family toxin n=1 Tax=Bathymodiolus platifrons methanotrophic gill symbiont TaxID=113268 RepID=UPI000B40C9AC|nr:type II toxin-antitoxin system RelE/ParE family toxin [Bathymodiolus platifrons methanotrophic gill symbiont]GAW87730.1 conserved hypothetical protein [Bathymodiolus platifrons methanotrophic gill symbiont]GFO77861.1 hypothetical protein BPLS_P6557 [Bathymodiolus platifrons methanotrophic gill symbiont]